MQTLIDILNNKIHRLSPACHFYEDFKLVRSLTYKDILENANKYACYINNNYPEYGNKNILISLETSAEFVFSFFGIILSGNIPVPITSKTLILESDYNNLLKHITNTAKSDLILSDKKVDIPGVTTLLTKDLNSYRKERLFGKKEIGNTAFIQFSSGSTQLPKGVEITHENILHNLEQIKKGMKVTDKDITFSWLPLHHDMGLIGILLSSLYTHAKAHMMPPVDFLKSPINWLKLLTKTETTIIVSPNSGYKTCTTQIKSYKENDINLSNIRLALSGAEQVNYDVCSNFQKDLAPFGLRENVIFPVYGLAESTLAVSFHEINTPIDFLKVDKDSLQREMKIKQSPTSELRIVSCGKVLDGTQIKIKKDQKDSEVGEILLKGPSIALNYYNKESHLTSDGWLKTGDLGFIQNDLLYIVGRTKDMVIIAGRNIAAHDIEYKASQCANLKMGRIAAFSTLDKSNNEKVVIVAETDLYLKSKREELKKEISKKLSSLVPITSKEIHLVPTRLLKKTTSGKVRRHYVKKCYLSDNVKDWENSFIKLQLKSDLQKNFLKIKTSLSKERQNV